MTEIIPSRRGFLIGLGGAIIGAKSALAMPAIIRLAPIMPIKIIPANMEDLAKLGHWEKEIKTLADVGGGGYDYMNGIPFWPKKVTTVNQPDIIQKVQRKAEQEWIKSGLIGNDPLKNLYQSGPKLEWFNADGTLRED